MGVSLYLVFHNRLLRPTKRLRLIFLTIIFLVYLFAGSYIFVQINLPVELEERQEMVKYMRYFESTHKCIDKEDLVEFINLITDASDNGIVFVQNSTDYTPNWVFGGETLFTAFTLLATIGYGHAAPLTQNGKLFCIFYVAFGVPLTLLFLSLIVDRIEYNLTKNFSQSNYSSLNDNKKYRFKSYTSISDNIQKQENKSPVKRRFFFLKNIYLQVFTIGSILLVFIYLIPALVFTNITELHWSFLDAIYYSYISIATIGFGDFVPGQDQVGFKRNIYRLIMTVYLLIGIIVNMLFLNLFIRLPLISKIYDSILKFKRKKFYEVLVYDSDEENDKNSEEVDRSRRSSNSSISQRNSPLLIVEGVDETGQVDSIDNITNVSANSNKSVQSRHGANLFSSKTKFV